MNLDLSPEELRRILHEASDLVADFYAGLEGRKVFRAPAPERVRSLFDEPLPEAGERLEALLEEVRSRFVELSTHNTSPHFYAYMTGGGNHAAIVAELVSVALNQNTLKWHIAPAATEIERRVVRWIAEWIGYSPDAGGVLVSGGSVANLTCLAVARKMRAPADVSRQGVRAAPPMTIYISSEGHSCIEKSLDLLGLGRDRLRTVPVTAEMTIDVPELERAITSDRAAGLHPIAVVGIAGTTNTGAVDPLAQLADLCERQGLWFHVDAAYGGPAAGTGLVGKLFTGMERADSVAIDPHKWLYVPFEAGCVLVRDPAHLRETFSLVADYLRSDADRSGRFDLMERSFQLTKDAKALKIWMTFKAYGARGLRAAIEQDIEQAWRLRELIEESRDFELLAPVPLSVVCFRYRPEGWRGGEAELDLLNQRLLDAAEDDGRVFLTGTRIRGRQALRACLLNHRRREGDLRYLLDVLREVGARASG